MVSSRIVQSALNTPTFSCINSSCTDWLSSTIRSLTLQVMHQSAVNATMAGRPSARVWRIFCGSQAARGVVRNLSKEGLFLRSDTLPEPGATVQVLLQPPGNPKVEVMGIVRWTTDQLPDRVPGQNGFGVRIENPPDDFLELFARLLLN